MAKYTLLTSERSVKVLLMRKKSFIYLVLTLACVALILLQKPEAVDHISNLRYKIVDFTRDSRLLENIFHASFKPKYDGRSIFFLETHLNEEENKIVTLTARQACSVESAGKYKNNILRIISEAFNFKFSALSNPDSDIFLIFFREVGFFNETVLPLIDAILSYPNVHINHADIYDYSENTPLEEWMRSGILFESKYVLSHTSDILRFLTLWRYTGIYLDLDMIIKKRVDLMGKNFAVNQMSQGIINSAVLNLDSRVGRMVAERFFKETIDNFNTTTWIGNGPDVITRIVQNMCNTTDIHSMTHENCDGFAALPPETCFAIDWHEHKKFFESKYAGEVLERIKDSFIVHFWSNLSKDDKFVNMIDSAYFQLAQQYCPRVLKANGYFL